MVAKWKESSMRSLMIIGVMLAAGCGRETPQPLAAVDCDVQLILLDGTPLGEKPVSADSHGFAHVFMIFDPETIPVDQIKDRPIQSVEHWSATLCDVVRVDDDGVLVEAAPIGSLIPDRRDVPEAIRDALAKADFGLARPDSFRKQVDGHEYWHGTIRVPPDGGRKTVMLCLYPTMDPPTAVPTTRNSGPPVTVRIVEVEFARPGHPAGIEK